MARGCAEVAAGAQVSSWHGASVRVGLRITSENGITFAVGKSLPARGKLTRRLHDKPRAHLFNPFQEV